MHYVYLIRSESKPDQTYIGLTSNLKERIDVHNRGSVAHTSKYRPWSLETCLGFKSREKASEFERYLKSGSGWAFAKRRLW